MRTFKEITDELGSAMDLVIGKKKELDETIVKADKMIAEANNMKSTANKQFADAQDNVFKLRKEYDDLMNSFAPMGNQSHVRQSR